MKILLVYKRPRPDALAIHDACLEHVESVLTAKKINFETCYREDLTQKRAGDCLLITVGGDGTVLEASHHVLHNVVLGVNSNPKSSVGSLCVADMDTFESVLEAYLSGDLKPVAAMRIGLVLDGRQLPVKALNDVLVANANPAAMTRYWFEVDGERTFHKNSGLWIATACGSSGALASSGGKVQKIEDTRLQWLCREPYFAEPPIPKHLAGFLAAGHEINIRSCMADGRIFIDGPHWSEAFTEGKELVLSVSKDSFNWIMTPELEDRRQKIGLLREKYEFERRHESPGV